jgi:hypothetical protein
MKNIITPRTLADCEFTVGYPIADLSRHKVKAISTALVICGAYVVLPITLVLILLYV